MIENIRALQTRLGITVDGVMGPKTWNALWTALGGPPASAKSPAPPPVASPPASPFKGGILIGQKSRDKLKGIHPDLLKIVERAAQLSPIEFTVLEGLRTVERQRQLVASGASKTMNSRHLTGHAVDLAPMLDGKVSWDWPLYHKLAPVVKQAAKDVGVPIEWGGDWRSFKDGPHWQLPFASFPK